MTTTASTQVLNAPSAANAGHQLVWVQNLIGFINGQFPADETWKSIFIGQLEALGTFESGRKAGLNEAAAMLDNEAQEYNRMRDPGMANHCRARAKRIRAIASKATS